MNFLQKFINYFNSNFYKNLKFSNSIHKFLRLFYERTTKTGASFFSFGNIFKNSKWNNYRTQNIKSTFKVLFTINHLIIFFTFIYLFNYHYELFLTLKLTFYSSILSTIDNLSSFFSSLFLSFLAITYVLKAYVSNLFRNIQPREFQFSFNWGSTRQTFLIFHTEKSPANENSNEHLNKCLKAYGDIFNLTQAINSYLGCNFNCTPWLKKLFTFEKKMGNLADKNCVIVDNNDTSNFAKNFTFSICELNNNLKLNALSNINLNDSNFPVLSKDKTSDVTKTTLRTNNINSTLAIFKQARWLVKNSLLSDKYITNTNKYTEFKKCIGVNSFLAGLPNNNVWASTNFSKIQNSENISKYISGGSITKNEFKSNSILNKFDESQIWIFKKIYFNTVNRNYDISLTNLFTIPKNSFNFSINQTQAQEFFKISLLNGTPHFNSDLSFKIHFNNEKKTQSYVYNTFGGLSEFNLLNDECVDNIINLISTGNTNFDLFYFYGIKGLDLNSTAFWKKNVNLRVKPQVLNVPFSYIK